MDRYKTKTKIGLAYPITKTDQPYFDTTFDSNSNAISSLRLFFSTMKGERRLNPSYGTDLWKLTFEQNDEDIKDKIIEIINYEISKNFPEIILKDVIVNQNIKNIDIYQVEIEIKFQSSKYSKELLTLRFENDFSR